MGDADTRACLEQCHFRLPRYRSGVDGKDGDVNHRLQVVANYFQPGSSISWPRTVADVTNLTPSVWLVRVDVTDLSGLYNCAIIDRVGTELGDLSSSSSTFVALALTTTTDNRVSFTCRQQLNQPATIGLVTFELTRVTD